MANSKWIQFIRSFAKANNMTFGCALSHPECSRQYRQQNNIQKTRKNVKSLSNSYNKYNKLETNRLSRKSPQKSQSNTKTKTQRQRIREIANDLNIDINVSEIPDSELKNVRNRLGKMMVNPEFNPYIKR
jgi:hypothetical protein